MSEYPAAKNVPLPWRIRVWRECVNAARYKIRLLWARTGYRPFSRLIHKFGFHHMKANSQLDPSGVHYWCHWCGLRAFERYPSGTLTTTKSEKEAA